MMKCSVCDKRFVPRKENVYQVREKAEGLTKLTHSDYIYDVIECPRCGCQKKLAIRIPRISVSEQEEEQSV